MDDQTEKYSIVLRCEGMGDCLYAIPTIKKLRSIVGANIQLSIFTHHPELFRKCPYIYKIHHINDKSEYAKYNKHIVLFDVTKLPHFMVDTYDFISIPAGIGELSFREKQLEYFPVEEDKAEYFDVVLNTSETWPSRSWPVENWQKLADYILSHGVSVAVVGKDTYSKHDEMWKRSLPLKGCADLTNKLSLDQTYFTIKKCGLFITCQNGLSVLSGATDTEVIVLDMSIEWSKRAIYRNQNPHYKATYVKGNCQLYCCSSFECQTFGEFRCIPTVEQVIESVGSKLLSDSCPSKINEDWIHLIGKPISLESQTHPHCEEEKAYLYHSFDSGGTEIEVIEVIRSLIKLFKPKMIIETGTWQGDGTVAIATAIKENGTGKLISLEINPSLAKKAVDKISNLKLHNFAEVINQPSIDFIEQIDTKKFKFDLAFFDSATNIRPLEFYRLYEKGALTDLIAFHDTSRLREKTLVIPGEPQDEYVKAMDEIEQKYCRGGIEFHFSRGFRIMQLSKDINPAYTRQF